MAKQIANSKNNHTLPKHLIYSITITIAITLTLAILLFTVPSLGLSQKPITDAYKSTGEYDHSQELGTFYGKTVHSLFNSPITYATRPQVLGYPSYKRIEVDLTNQRLYAYEGNNKVYDFLVSTGKWGRTPTGIFNIWIKLRYTKMEGGNTELRTYYYLPNVPYTMFFANKEIPAWRGFGIHGTYWHNNFGTPMSHGCINMKTEEAGLIYEWAEPILPQGKKSIKATQDNPGTPIVIYGVAPK